MIRASQMFFPACILLLLWNAPSALSKPSGTLDGRIVGGQTASIEDYPYQVSIVYIDTHQCGGTILSTRHILTAAHCTNNVDAEDLFIRAGSTIVTEGGQVVFVKTIHQHQNYNSETYDNDISILELEDDLVFGRAVASVSLPTGSSQYATGTPAVATGWGRLSDGGPVPLELQEVVLPLLADNTCSMVYGSLITGSMFCAGVSEGGKDTCQGDSGGPLVGNGVILGITSWGDGCGAMNSPGVYTRVLVFRDYINNIIN